MVPDEFEKLPPVQLADRWIKTAHDHRYLICRAFCGLTLPFRRYGGGREVEGRFLALVMLAFWTFFTHDLFCLFYSVAWFIGMIFYALTTSSKVHSRWDGRPYLMLLIPSYWLAATLEAAFVGCIAYLTLTVAPLFGMLLFSSSLGLAASLVLDWWERRREMVAWTDNQIVMENRRRAYQRWR